MEIKLKLRAVTAYFSPAKVILADNEDVTIKILDKGQLGQRVVLCCNGKTYVATGKSVVIPRADLGEVNTMELTERDVDTDKVITRIGVENLYVLPCAAGDEGNRLVAEREFYKHMFVKLLEQVDEQGKRQKKLEKRVADLENGKFTMLKFGGDKQ